MALPPKAQFKTTSFGVKKRDLLISGGGVLIGIAVLAVNFAPVMARVFIFVIIAGASALLAFWRVEGQWPIEQYLIGKTRWGKRNRKYVKGGAKASTIRDISFEAYMEESAPAEKALFSIWDFSNEQLLFTVISLSALGVLLAWLGTGGIEEAQLILRSIVRQNR